MRGRKLDATREEKVIIGRLHVMAEHCGSAIAYYLPDHDSVTFRRQDAIAKHIPPNVAKLPENAIFIGLYRQPVDGHAFVEDLRCVRASGSTAKATTQPPT